MTTIDAKKLAAVSLFAAKGDARYYLNYVYVEPCEGGQMIVGTNGHVLAALFDATSTPLAESAFIKIKTVKDRNAVKKMGRVSLDELDRFMGESGVEIQPASFAAYPDWRRVVPPAYHDDDLPRTVTLNGDYLATFRDAAKLLGRKMPALELVPAINGATRVNIGVEDFAGCIMPIRANAEDSASLTTIPGVKA